MTAHPEAALRPSRPLSPCYPFPARKFLAALLLSIGTCAANAVVTLPSYNIDASRTSISGLSSGAFMAAQMHVAYSATFHQGAGIVAGGPFYCAQGSIVTAIGPCMAPTATSKPATANLISITNNWAAQGTIDPVSNLSGSRVYLYSGTLDSVVKQPVMDQANVYYKNFVNNANIFYKNTIASEHAMITDYFGSGCSTKGSPYIDNCHLDLAGDLLKWIYGPMNPKNTGALGGSFVEFNQTDFIASPASHGMAATGWLYVPANCTANQSCQLHVVLHGCQQDPTKIGDQYYRNTGYNKWADTNNMVILYPQTAPSSSGNPNGCWDWWGYDDANYAKKSGRQMVAIKGMVDKLSSGFVALPAPTGLTVSAVSNTSVSLSWNGVSGAAGYNVYRDGGKVNAAAVAATGFNDAGLASGTAYRYAVTAVTSSGASSAASASATATTTGTPPPLTAPNGVAVTATTASTVSLSWSAVNGATGYNVYRNGTRANSTVITATAFSDGALAASTTYSYAVSAVNGSTESALSAAVPATTRSSFVCSSTSASNYAHVLAGRAHDGGGYALANGSNQNMGLDNLFFTATLAQTAPGYYVIGTCH